MKFPRTELLPVLTTIMLLGRTDVSSAQDTNYTDVSCVQVSNISFSTTCPCGVTPFSFSIVGETSVTDLVVNLAVVLDGSGSVGSTNFLTEKEFAKNITTAFAERNLFDNGGTASYVQFTSYVDANDTGTFYSLEDFNDFVDNNEYNSGGTDIDDGIAAARELLNAAPSASVAYMIVLTDGISTIGTEANDSRADGIILFAVGVGSSVSDDVLLAIAGSESNVFSVDEFDDLEAVVGDILDNGTTTVSCPATNVTLTVEFGTTVDSVVSDPEATLSNDTVIFLVSDLEDNPTNFKVMLDTCGAAEPVDPVLSITYSDDQGNSPNFTELLGIKSYFTCPPVTSPPTLSPTLSSTPSPTSSTTPSPTLPPTLSSTSSPTSSTTPSSTLSRTLPSTTSPTSSSTASPTSSTTPSSTLSRTLPSTTSPTSSSTASPTSSTTSPSTPSSAPSSTSKPDCHSDEKTHKNKKTKRGKGPKGKGHE